MRRRDFLGSLVATASGLLIPDWGQRVFPMYPRNVLFEKEVLEFAPEGFAFQICVDDDMASAKLRYWDGKEWRWCDFNKDGDTFQVVPMS